MAKIEPSNSKTTSNLEKTAEVENFFIPSEEKSEKFTKREMILMSTQDLFSSVMPQLSLGSTGLISILWALAYLFFTGIFAFQTYETMVEYFSHPVVVSITLEKSDQPVDFPAVTVCNNNPLRRSMVSRISFMEGLAFLDR